MLPRWLLTTFHYNQFLLWSQNLKKKKGKRLNHALNVVYKLHIIQQVNRQTKSKIQNIFVQQSLTNNFQRCQIKHKNNKN